MSQLLPRLGTRRLSAITTLDLQELVDAWQVEGHAPSTIRNWLKPLQAIYRRARTREGLPLYDLYGHLMPGAEWEAAALLDTFLEDARMRCRPALAGSLNRSQGTRAAQIPGLRNAAEFAGRRGEAVRRDT